MRARLRGLHGAVPEGDRLTQRLRPGLRPDEAAKATWRVAGASAPAAVKRYAMDRTRGPAPLPAHATTSH